MQFQINFEQLPGLLVVTGTGPASLQDLCRYMDEVSERAAAQGVRRALLDLSGVEIDFSAADHEVLGRHTATVLRRLQRVASLVPVRYRVGTSERAAQQGGLHFRTFTDVVAAMQWLQAD